VLSSRRFGRGQPSSRRAPPCPGPRSRSARRAPPATWTRRPRGGELALAGPSLIDVRRAKAGLIAGLITDFEPSPSGSLATVRLEALRREIARPLASRAPISCYVDDRWLRGMRPVAFFAHRTMSCIATLRAGATQGVKAVSRPEREGSLLPAYWRRHSCSPACQAFPRFVAGGRRQTSGRRSAPHVANGSTVSALSGFGRAVVVNGYQTALSDITDADMARRAGCSPL
jgi:hypothetical protein